MGMGYEHREVNHTEGYVNENGDHSNSIEDTWRAVKVLTPIRNRNMTHVPWFLLQFIWRRKHHCDLWDALLRALRDVSFTRGSNNPPFLTELDKEDFSPSLADDYEGRVNDGEQEEGTLDRASTNNSADSDYVE
jgi:hypothetical protein